MLSYPPLNPIREICLSDPVWMAGGPQLQILRGVVVSNPVPVVNMLVRE